MIANRYAISVIARTTKQPPVHASISIHHFNLSAILNAPCQVLHFSHKPSSGSKQPQPACNVIVLMQPHRGRADEVETLLGELDIFPFCNGAFSETTH